MHFDYKNSSFYISFSEFTIEKILTEMEELQFHCTYHMLPYLLKTKINSHPTLSLDLVVHINIQLITVGQK